MTRWGLALWFLLATPPALAQSPADSLAGPGWVQRPAAELQALDKVTARVSTLRARVGEPLRFGTLTVAVRACHARPPDESADSAAWLEITDSRPNRLPGGVETPPGGVVFRGWMFAERPAVNMLEHPVYDLRLLACR
jgi:hypothetical protein